MSRSSLVGLAVLKVNWERQQRDYIDNFVPLIVECIRLAPQHEVSLPDLQAAVEAKFGLRVPANPLKQILQRAAKAGFVRRESGVYYRHVARCDAQSFTELQRHVESRHDSVVAALAKFAFATGQRWSHAEAEEALLAFITESGLATLFASAERASQPATALKEDAVFVVGRFVVEARVSSPTLFDDIETLIKGSMLADALYLPDPGRVAQRFVKTAVFLDTPLVINALGYSGRERQVPAEELLALLREYGADTCCFSITVDEARGILDACAARMRLHQLRDAHGSALEHFIGQGLTSSDVELMAARLPERIRQMGITIVDRPPYDSAGGDDTRGRYAFQVDEQGFESHLDGVVRYAHPKGRVHDVDCVSAIARLRRCRDVFMVETCRAIFVTPNAALARSARQFFQKDAAEGAVALCMSEYALGNLLWLKNPTKAPDLPRRRLIADAYAAMQPPDHLWKVYLAEIARMEERGGVTADDYYILRHSLAAKAALMEITHGNPAAFGEGTVGEILQVAREHVRADLQESLRERIDAEAAARRRIAELESAESQRRARVRRVADTVACWTARAVSAIVLMGLAIGSAYTFPWALPSVRAGWQRYLLTATWVALFAYGISSLIWGTTLLSLNDWLRAAVSSRLERRMLRWLDAPPTPDSASVSPRKPGV